MYIAEVSNIYEAPTLMPAGNFIVSGEVQVTKLVSSWMEKFKAPDERVVGEIKINQFIIGLNKNYTATTSLAACWKTPGTFFFDFMERTITVHYIHTQAWYTDRQEVSQIRGFCTDGPITFDGIQYPPLIIKVPDITQRADISEGSKLTFMKGLMTFNNTDGQLDNIFDLSGAQIFLRWLEEEPGVVDYYERIKSIYVPHFRKVGKGKIRYIEDRRETGGLEIVKAGRHDNKKNPRVVTVQGRKVKRSISIKRKALVSAERKRKIVIKQKTEKANITDIATLYIDDYKQTLKEVGVSVQDLRRKQDVLIPTETYSRNAYDQIEKKYEGKIIPLIYGKCIASYATPIDGAKKSGSVTYRQSTALSQLGDVYLLQDDDEWGEASDSIDRTASVGNGSFTLPALIARKDSGLPRKCYVANSVGIPVEHASDVIKDLNKRFLGIDYNTNNYDVQEWEEEQEMLSRVGLYIDKRTKLHEIISQLQRRSNLNFRFEFNTKGKRTVRVNNPQRESLFHIRKEEIDNIDELPVSTDRDQLAAIVSVHYNYDHVNKNYLTVTNREHEQVVFNRERQRPERVFDTFLTDKYLAEERGANDANTLSKIVKRIAVRLKGSRFFSLRIYDTITIELTPSFINANGEYEGRKYLGTQKALVLSISPKNGKLVNEITAYLIEEA